MTRPAPRRCAIYTRKSSDEGLDQAFNSLDAQREAGEAYVKSQAGEGWRTLPALYDDGGYSGGSMERPALQRLLADADAGLVDVVVVYKIDRLTRSLADFARIVERIDARGISFVSVTQAFNTTSSMGRLTARGCCGSTRARPRRSARSSLATSNSVRFTSSQQSLRRRDLDPGSTS